MFGRKRELGEGAIEALKWYREKPESLEWIALDAFRIWYYKVTDDGLELNCVEFEIKEVK